MGASQMSREDLKAQYDALEGSTTTFRHSRQTELGKILKGYEELSDSEQTELLRTELAAFYLSTRGDSFPGYYQPAFVMTDGSTSPSLGYFTDTRLDYLSKRASNTTNPIHAARFADVAWDLRRKKQVNDAHLAIDQYIKCAQLYKKNLWGQEYGESIHRASDLAITTNDIKRINILKQLILEEFVALDSRQDYRYCLDLARSIESGQKRFAFTDIEKAKLLEILKKAIGFYTQPHPPIDTAMGPTSGPNWHFVRAFLEKEYELQKIFQQNPNNKSYKKALAETYVAEAMDREPLARLVFLQNAERLYSEAGLTEERDRIRVELGLTGKQAEADMTSVSTSINIPDAEVDKYITPLIATDISETIKNISRTHRFFPSVKQTQEATEKRKAKYPLASFFPTIALKDGYISPSETEKHDATFIRDFVMGIQIGGFYRTRLFERLRTAAKFSTDSLAKHVATWGHCDADTLTLLTEGFQHYFKEDYIATIHILIPQFESLLRGLLEKAGRPIHDPQTGKFYVLGDLLRDPALATLAGEDLIYWYQMSLSSPFGLNLRNDVSHALCSRQAFCKENAELIIHLLLSLTRFTINEEAVGGEAPQKPDIPN